MKVVDLTASALALAGALALACGSSAPRSASSRIAAGLPPHDASIAAACQETARRCTACHDPDRFLDLRPSEPRQWEGIIAKMRRMRGSGISLAEGQTIVRCLVFRSFGADGLRALDPPR